MTNEEKLKKAEEALKDSDIFEATNVSDINHKPHPYCLTEKHLGKHTIIDRAAIIEAEKDGAHCGIYTGPNGEIYNGYKRGYTPCHVPYEDHTSDNVLFLKLKRDVKNDEAVAALKSMIKVLGDDFVDGFTFVETKEKFRILS